MLGADCARGGPFALLELTPRSTTDDAVIAALDRQLTRLASHPQCDTPEADEIRLALHAAAVQLLDEKVREHLVAHWGGAPAKPAASSELPTTTVVQTASPTTRALTRDQVALEHDAILTFGMLGGWNSKSLRHLLSLAHARGMNSSDVAQTLSRLGRRRVPIGPGSPPQTPSSKDANGAPALSTRTAQPMSRDEPPAEEASPGDEAIRTGLIVIGVTVAAIFIAVPLILFFAIQGASSPDPLPEPTVPPPVVAETDPTIPGDAKTPASGSEPAPDSGLENATIAFELGGEGAVEEFASSVRRLASEWAGQAPDQRVASMHQIIEFFYQSSRSTDLLGRCIAEVGRGARRLENEDPLAEDEVLETVWSVGALTRLARERDLPVLARTDIARRLSAALGDRRVVFDQSFKSGALVAVGMLPARLLPSQSEGTGAGPWLRWMDAVEALTEGDVESRTQLLIQGLETLLVDGPEPNEDQSVFEGLRALVKRIPWRLGDESRRRVVAWFDDPRISSADLHALTATLAGESSAGGVDVTMVLPLLASERVRTEMQDRYASAWGLSNTVDKARLAEELIRAAMSEIGDGVAPDAPESAHLAKAVVLSRLTEAVAWAWRGRTQEADELLAGLSDGISQQSAAGAGGTHHLFTGPASSSGNSWEERYLSARSNVRIRLDLLDQIGRGMPSAVAAELVVEEALRGTPSSVRTKAREAVLANTTNAGVVNAILEQLPFAPRTIDNSKLIETASGRVLPPPSSDDWERAARRALVERLLEMVSASGQFAQTDELVAHLGTTYAGRISGKPLVGPDRIPGDPPDVSAPLLWRRWRERVDRATPNTSAPMQLETIERRRTARLNQAQGPIQFFAAQQVSVCELMSYVIAGEAPERSRDVAEVVDDLTAARQSARHVLEQIHAVERAMLRLWLIRIGEEVAWTG